MQTKPTSETDTPSSTTPNPLDVPSSFLDTIDSDLRSWQASSSMPSGSRDHEPRYVITPSLWVIPVEATQGGVTIVSTFDEAREILRQRGLPDCCVEDRISVSKGGPVLCGGHAD